MNDAKRMLILIITLFQVTFWDGSQVEGVAGNNKEAKLNAAFRKLKAHSNYYLWWKPGSGRCGRQQTGVQMNCLLSPS
jgi:hypothetical protein